MTDYINIKKDSILIIWAIILSIFVCCLYAYNPDDSTFYHRVAYVLDSLSMNIQTYDTRIAYDRLPPISAAHLITSWEFVLSLIGSMFNSPLFGYQIGGTIISILLYSCSFVYTARYFNPNITNYKISIVFFIFTIMLMFDGDRNSSIGSWLFLGGWTGKCFLSAFLMMLFPALDKAINSEENQDWLFVAMLLVTYTGLSGSALFIVPVGVMILVVVNYFTTRVISIKGIVFSFIPVVVGLLFIIDVGSLVNDSYWRSSTDLPWADYVTLTMSERQFWLYLALVILCAANNKSSRKDKVVRFLIYQLIVMFVLFNPFVLDLLKVFIPSDGLWRIFYLIQYPTVMLILLLSVVNLLELKKHLLASIIIVFISISLIGATNIFSRQEIWGYPQHFKRPFEPKIDLRLMDSIKFAAKHCKVLKDGGVILAPERWEVASQMLYPNIQSISARHMIHNFNNIESSSLNISYSLRNNSVGYISGLNQDFAIDFLKILDFGIDVIVLDKSVVVPDKLNNYMLISDHSSKYNIFCLP